MLKDINILPVYDSSEHDLIKDMFIPLLSNSVQYFRGVGFFASGWVSLVAEGLAHLIDNGGKAEFVVSPLLNQEDLAAIEKGDADSNSDALLDVLERDFESLIERLQNDTLNALAWMVSDEIVSFKFAIPRDQSSIGDYHDKVAVFVDAVGDRVAIHGSFNDTYKGSLNGEAFSVFKGWDEGQLPYVEKHHKRILALLNDTNKQFKVYETPQAIKEKLIECRMTEIPPYGSKGSVVKSGQAMKGTKELPKLRDYQQLAIDNWTSSNRVGIFDMATGTGKTITSLAAASGVLQNDKKLFLIITVPFLHLLEQWEDDAEKYFDNIVLASGDHTGWKANLYSQIQDFMVGITKQVVVISTQATASTRDFGDLISKVSGENAMLIADEVHYLGSRDLRNALFETANMRLGLSATPKRWQDPEGTQTIYEYFKGVCFEFPLEEAIGKYLVQYDYFPILVNLSDEELEEYVSLTNSIGQLVSKNSGFADDERLKILLMKRAHIINAAEEKLPKLRAIIGDKLDEYLEMEVPGVLFYCAPGTHREYLSEISRTGLLCHEFVHNVKLSDRQKVLKDFSAGQIQALVAIKCLDEGVDIPATKEAFFLSSTTNPREFVQRRGRILRKSPGKNLAKVYDFIVVPKNDSDFDESIAISILKREMPRFAEFSASARNQFEARAVLRPLLDRYGLLHMLEERPWELYAKMMDEDDSLALEIKDERH